MKPVTLLLLIIAIMLFGSMTHSLLSNARHLTFSIFMGVVGGIAICFHRDYKMTSNLAAICIIFGLLLPPVLFLYTQYFDIDPHRSRLVGRWQYLSIVAIIAGVIRLFFTSFIGSGGNDEDES